MMGGQKPQGEGQEYGGEHVIYHHELPSKKNHNLGFVLLTAQRMPSLSTRQPVPGMVQLEERFLQYRLQWPGEASSGLPRWPGGHGRRR